MIDALASTLTLLVNGLWAIVSALLSPVAVLIIISGACLTWFAVLEIDELSRRGRKPDVPLH